MHLIVGLGNKGSAYSLTRHNIGFEAVERYAYMNSMKISTKGLYSHYAKSAKLVLAKPQTYMNLSGQAVWALARYFSVANENILILHDDLDFEPGIIKIRKSGSGGSHNGIRDIIEVFGTQDIARVRIGIGRPQGPAKKDYVLSRFNEAEIPIMQQAVLAACEAVDAFIYGGIDYAMNECNRKGRPGDNA
ncbi:MAG: aminoacyl-tRNA hydrolase [Eubacteriaceae bacterium]|nr:aminoacyl-tRNA hydrolase [Eubacteriaceae bacterium]